MSRPSARGPSIVAVAAELAAEEDRKVAPDVPMSLLNGPVHRCIAVRRSGGMWVSEVADVPQDIWERYVIPSKTHGPDLFGMCTGQAEFEFHMLKERG